MRRAPVKVATLDTPGANWAHHGDGNFAVVANEGEPEGYEAGQVDPEGCGGDGAHRRLPGVGRARGRAA